MIIIVMNKVGRKKSIEELSRVVSGTYNDTRRCYHLIGFADERGDFSATTIKCRNDFKTIFKMLNMYGNFTDDDARLVEHLGVGNYKSWGTDKCMIIRVA